MRERERREREERDMDGLGRVVQRRKSKEGETNEERKNGENSKMKQREIEKEEWECAGKISIVSVSALLWPSLLAGNHKLEYILA